MLRSIRFAFDVLNDKFGQRGVRITKRNTIVIASSVSNGGGASVMAVEHDSDGLIDGLAVGEPNVNPKFRSDFSIVQGGGPAFFAHSRPLIDYITLVNVFQSCANLAPANAGAGLNLPVAQSPARCADLKAKGLLIATTLPDQATEAQKIINDFGILPEQNLVQPGYSFANVAQSISVTYANAYGRFSVLDNLCSFSLAANGGVPGGAASADRGRRGSQDLQHEQRHSAVDGSASSLRYYEVTNAHHLDSFNQFPGYSDKYIPLHRYFNQAMDLMYAHLRQGAPLPPSQVVHTTPRGPGAPPITAANVPPIAASPPASALITFSGGQVHIPN